MIDNDIDPPMFDPDRGPAWMRAMSDAPSTDDAAKEVAGRHEGLADYTLSWSTKPQQVSGLMLAWAMLQANVKPPKEFMSTEAWSAFGFDVKTPELGCVVVLADRVGVFSHQIGTTIYLLGGLQDDVVDIRAFRESDILACRWPDADDYDTGYSPAPG